MRESLAYNKLLYCSIVLRTPKDISIAKHIVENWIFLQSLFGMRAVFPTLTR